MPMPIASCCKNIQRIERRWRNEHMHGYGELCDTVCQLEQECEQWEESVRLFCSTPGITSAQLAEAIRLLTSK